jgi:eukaryotic-like serine/threonine-protein kinase
MADPLERLRGALAGRYALERELGAGGMAVVYLARDLRHDREVALKVVRPELTAHLGPERFLREIAITGRLQHPHIMPLLDSGEADGLLYYVMPYVAGETLRQRLDRERQLPVEEALRLTREVADALDYAHRQGVVHRDLKPENLLLVDGHAVVADFGIARAVRAAGQEKLTTTGTLLGTPTYMSPEQATGAVVDGRSDQYSLACVLYELLAGTPPFVGPGAVHQHLSVTPRPVTEMRASVPDAVAAALQRALAKTAADRYDTAGRFGASLGAAMPTPAGESRASTSGSSPIAAEGKPAPTQARRGLVAAVVLVLLAAGTFVIWKSGLLSDRVGGRSAPFAKKDWILVAEFEGPADDTSLAVATRDLVCAALDQSAIVATVPDDQIRLALERAGKPPGTRVDAALAHELAYRRSIRAVVEGRVGRLGGGYSIVVRVVDADSGRVVTAVSDAARSDEELIPTLSRVVRRLRDALGERREDLRATRELVEVMTPSFEAYRRYSKAVGLMNGGDNRGCIAMNRSALSLDRDFAAAWGVIGFGFGNLGETDSALAAFDEALRRPERLDEERRFRYAAQAAFLRGDVPGALATLDQSLRHDLSTSWTYNNRGTYLRNLGRREEALTSSRLAMEFGPFGPNRIIVENQFWTLLELGRLGEAREVARQLKGGLAEAAPGLIALAAGDWAAAESLGRVLERLPDPAASDFVLAVARAARGSVRAAVQSLQREQRAAAEERRYLDLEHAKRGRLLLDLVSGRLKGVPDDVASSDTTTLALVTQGLWEAAAGDTARARRLLVRIRRRSVIEQNRQGSSPVLIEAWLAARAGRFGETVELLGPAALQGDDIGFVPVRSNRALKRWLVAEAYQGLGRPDSAAAYFELAMSPIGDAGALRDARIAFSYAHRRLVLLYARMGRLEEARRHQEILAATFTRPDPEMLPLIEEARTALASAEAMTGKHRR